MHHIAQGTQKPLRFTVSARHRTEDRSKAGDVKGDSDAIQKSKE
jgi:hypothetical protein